MDAKTPHQRACSRCMQRIFLLVRVKALSREATEFVGICQEFLSAGKALGTNLYAACFVGYGARAT